MGLNEEQRRAFRHHWRLWARDEQVAPENDWRTWLILAGRGFGKTRAGAEWVREIAGRDPDARIALVGASLNEVRAVMVEGESGLMAVCPLGSRPRFEPSLRRLQWDNGAQAMLYSAGEPDSLRGPQHSHACRAGAEGSLRQRGARPCRHPAALRGGGHGLRAALHAGAGRDLAGRGRADRRLERPRGLPRRVPGRRLGLRQPSRRIAGARPLDRPGQTLCRGLASSGTPGRPRRRQRRGRRSACDSCNTSGQTFRGRNICPLAGNSFADLCVPSRNYPKMRHSCNSSKPMTACAYVALWVEMSLLGGSIFVKRGKS